MALSVYLVHYEAPGWVRSAASTILASDIPVHLTVVSNSGPVDVPGAEVVVMDVNRGYAGAANVALRAWLRTGAPYTVIGSHDLHVEQDTLRLLNEAADRSPDFGILGPDTPTNRVGELLGELDGIEVRAEITGTCLFLRRECILQVGLFDETFGSYGEDNELCARARRHGWKVGRVPTAVARGLGTSAIGSRQLNGIANRLLLGWRTRGLRGVAAAYQAHLRLLARVALGRTQGVSRGVVLRALVVGTKRLAVGILRRPPAAPTSNGSSFS